MAKKQLFDDWPVKYEDWFRTPIGRMVLASERALVLDLLKPGAGELILDAGCGTGIFTHDFINAGSRVIGVDLSLPMVRYAENRLKGAAFRPVLADMLALPFMDDSFDRTVSITAIEFITDGNAAAAELLRVTKPGGVMVIATLNRLSAWADQRTADARNGSSIFNTAVFRSPAELLSVAPLSGKVETCVFFDRDEDPARAGLVEELGRTERPDTGAFVAARWVKPVS